MDSADDDKLEAYAKFADTLRHEATGLAGDPGLYLKAADVIEDLVARTKEAREDF